MWNIMWPFIVVQNNTRTGNHGVLQLYCLFPLPCSSASISLFISKRMLLPTRKCSLSTSSESVCAQQEPKQTDNRQMGLPARSNTQSFECF